MDQERWIQRRIGDLKYRYVLEGQMDEIPKRLIDKYTKFDVNETNKHGESLIIGVVKYVVGQRKQVYSIVHS